MSDYEDDEIAPLDPKPKMGKVASKTLTVTPEEYETLKEIMNQVVANHSNMLKRAIVLRNKISS